MRQARIALLIAALGAAAQAQAGMFDDEEARRQIKDLSIKIEARSVVPAKYDDSVKAPV